MGNCLRHEADMQRCGEECESPAAKKTVDSSEYMAVERRDETAAAAAATTTTKVKEVKIKITKKQLEELLGTVDVQGLSVQQVLAQLMTVSDRFETHQRSWRPALQSIPEVN